jgi:hypothetical protein
MSVAIHNFTIFVDCHATLVALKWRKFAASAFKKNNRTVVGQARV